MLGQSPAGYDRPGRGLGAGIWIVRNRADVPGDMALLHFTSGTTGKPKGAVHVHEAVVAHNVTGKLALDFHPDDIFWCTADPGWITGHLLRHHLAADQRRDAWSSTQAEFDAERWYRILQAPESHGLVHGADRHPHADEGRRRVRQAVRPIELRLMAASASRSIRRPWCGASKRSAYAFHDNWWQTETGGIMITNFLSMDVKPGSMGRPLPGIAAGIVEHLEGGEVREITKPMAMGELALAAGLAVDDARLSQRRRAL